jgi:hypothetical protein
MKVDPSTTGDVAAARKSEPRAKPADSGAFGAALAKASTEGPVPGTDVALDDTELRLRKGERVKPVDGHAYSDIVSGKRKGMFINTSGNERHGEAFVLARRNGVEYHIYGSGKDRLVVALRPATDRRAEAPEKPADAGDKADKAGDVKLRKGEKAEPVEGHAYSEIVSGPRSGMYINTSGGARHGEAFVLARRNGVEYHIYGSGKDREVVAVGMRD